MNSFQMNYLKIYYKLIFLLLFLKMKLLYLDGKLYKYLNNQMNNLKLKAEYIMKTYWDHQDNLLLSI